MILKQQARSLTFQPGDRGKALIASGPWASLRYHLSMRKQEVRGVTSTGKSGLGKPEESVEDLPKAGSGEVAEVIHERDFFFVFRFFWAYSPFCLRLLYILIGFLMMMMDTFATSA